MIQQSNPADDTVPEISEHGQRRFRSMVDGSIPVCLPEMPWAARNLNTATFN